MPPEERQAGGYALSVIVAEEQAAGNLPAVLAALRPEAYPEVEFLFCSTDPARLEGRLPKLANLRLLAGQPGERIPLLWRDGIRAARSERVALTSAHSVPREDWLRVLLCIELSRQVVAVGGVIRNAPDSDALGRAIYALRYCNYTASREEGVTGDLAADNAIYRRQDILEQESLLELGFWEPSFHERFLAAGRQMRFSRELEVVHRNLYSARAFLGQRFSHGIEFGLARAQSMSLGRRLLMIFLAPLLPLVFLDKLLRKARSDREIALGFGADFLWLVVFVFAWCLGEELGYLRSLFGSQSVPSGEEP